VDFIQFGNGGGGVGRKTVAVGGQRSFGKEEGLFDCSIIRFAESTNLANSCSSFESRFH
jgi:hypothetical protein